MHRWSWVLLASLFLTSCVTASVQRFGGVRIETNVPEATILVDEEARGPVRAYQEHYLRLTPGPHRLTLEHPDHFTEYIDVNVVDRMGMVVRLEMRHRPNE